MMIAKKMNRGGMNSSKTTSYKFNLSCAEKAKELQYDTQEWLQIQSQFDHSSDDYKIFSALLEGKKNIVVKVGTASKLTEEYEIGKVLSDCKNFIKFYCVFTCNNTLQNIDIEKSLCKSQGDTLDILVMPYYSLGRIDKYDWKRSNFNVLKSVLKHIVCSLLYAFVMKGFVHRDTHLGNILLKKTTKQSILYNKTEIETNNMLPIIMDFDRSTINKESVTVKQVYLDIQRVISLIRSELDIKINNSDIISILNNYISDQIPVTEKVYTKLCNLIDKLEIDFVVSELKLPW
jgi:serine/threonine protein kinase